MEKISHELSSYRCVMVIRYAGSLHTYVLSVGNGINSLL